MQELNAEPVIPDGFPEWKETMDSWGYKMISAIEVGHLSVFHTISNLCDLNVHISYLGGC